jgi:hypothetical protein
MIAEDLAKVINERYPLRWVRISVAEDNENGCEMEWEFDRDERSALRKPFNG